jgi:hypothetical protein
LGPDLHQAEFIVNGFSGGGGGSTPNGGALITPVPLRLLSFNAWINNAKTLLQWQTSAEINTDHFEIERSEDGRNFTNTIGRILAAGNSISERNYSLTDMQPVVGKNYYRLKMLDKDGAVSYSQVRLVVFSKNDKQINIYPNPAKDLLNIENNLAGKHLQISITDITGKKLLQWQKTNASLLQIPMANLSTGIYILQLNDGNTIINSKVEKK